MNTQFPSPKPGSAAQAYAFLLTHITAVTEPLVPNIDVGGAAELALATADRIQMLLPDILALGGFDHDAVVGLPWYAAAALEADLADARPPAPPLAMLEECGTLREDLLTIAEGLIRFGKMDRERVAAIRSGTGHKDAANDLCDLSVLYKELWPTLEGITPITKEMVERAGALGLQLHEMVGARQLYDNPLEPTSTPAHRRAQAFTLLVQAYDECRSAVAFLRRNHGDADVIAPSMYTKGRRRAAESGEGDEVTETVPVAEPPK